MGRKKTRKGVKIIFAETKRASECCKSAEIQRNFCIPQKIEAMKNK